MREDGVGGCGGSRCAAAFCSAPLALRKRPPHTEGFRRELLIVVQGNR